jgi:hypothetical protein
MVDLDQFGHWNMVARDGDLFALDGPLDQFRELRLGFMNIDLHDSILYD